MRSQGSPEFFSVLAVDHHTHAGLQSYGALPLFACDGLMVVWSRFRQNGEAHAACARKTIRAQQEDVMTKQAAAVNETQSTDAMLRARAQRVVPGGMWGHLNAARLPEGYPQFFASAEGCRVRDVDGREYIDFMCSWGPVLLGHRHPEVQAAVDAQAALGDCFNGPGEVMVELAEDFVAMVPHADWAMFQKNGGDAP